MAKNPYWLLIGFSAPPCAPGQLRHQDGSTVDPRLARNVRLVSCRVSWLLINGKEWVIDGESWLIIIN